MLNQISEPSNTSVASAFNKPNHKILISRKDLNSALFMGEHYQYDHKSNQQMFFSEAIDITVTAPRAVLHRPRNQPRQSDYVIHCTLRDVKTNQTIDLDFKQRTLELEFIKGRISSDNDNSQSKDITSAQDLSDTLLKIYKTVRGEVDKLWLSDVANKLEAREIAGQQLDTGMMPKIGQYTSGKFTIMNFMPSMQEQQPNCNKNCRKCKLNP